MELKIQAAALYLRNQQKLRSCLIMLNLVHLPEILNLVSQALRYKIVRQVKVFLLRRLLLLQRPPPQRSQLKKMVLQKKQRKPSLLSNQWQRATPLKLKPLLLLNQKLLLIHLPIQFPLWQSCQLPRQLKKMVPNQPKLKPFQLIPNQLKLWVLPPHPLPQLQELHHFQFSNNSTTFSNQNATNMMEISHLYKFLHLRQMPINLIMV